MSIEEIEAEILVCVEWARMEELIEMAVEWLFAAFEDRD